MCFYQNSLEKLVWSQCLSFCQDICPNSDFSWLDLTLVVTSLVSFFIFPFFLPSTYFMSDLLSLKKGKRGLSGTLAIYFFLRRLHRTKQSNNRLCGYCLTSFLYIKELVISKDKIVLGSERKIESALSSIFGKAKK